jgi:hypothetical protein
MSAVNMSGTGVASMMNRVTKHEAARFTCAAAAAGIP